MKTASELYQEAKKMKKEGYNEESIGKMLLDNGMRDLGTGWFIENMYRPNDEIRYFRDVETIALFTGTTKFTDIGCPRGLLYRSYHF